MDTLKQKLAEVIEDGVPPGLEIEDVAAALRALSMRWIPVEERLPEEDGWKIVAYRGVDGVLYTDRYTAFYDPEHGWIDHEAAIHGTITHWMPLPEPPEDL